MNALHRGRPVPVGYPIAFYVPADIARAPRPVIVQAASASTPNMKVMDSRSGLGAGGYGEHWQQRHGCEGALSCFEISGLRY